MAQETCPIFERCMGCNDGYECVDQATMDAWAKEHGMFDDTKVTMPYNHDLAPGEKGPLEWRIAYTLNRRRGPHRLDAPRLRNVPL